MICTPKVEKFGGAYFYAKKKEFNTKYSSKFKTFKSKNRDNKIGRRPQDPDASFCPFQQDLKL